MKRFEANKVIKDRNGNQMETMMWDFYSTGNPILCVADEDSIYPAREFDPRDWEVVNWQPQPTTNEQPEQVKSRCTSGKTTTAT